jgi:UDP-glucuronate 4-epimerase
VKLIITGVAGFIGMHTALRLLDEGHEVVGIDNLNDYYDVGLKKDRLGMLEQKPGFRHHNIDISESQSLTECVTRERPERVVHLAAQPGVRYSLENPMAYVSANLVGFANILEACRHNDVHHLIYASSSSVYGDNAKVPFSEHDPVDHPLSLYAASKRANELMAHSYSHLYDLPTTGLRFFTVYGPWGRPDMAPIKFARSICEGSTIRVFNHGNHQRDFTFVNDIVDGVAAVTLKAKRQSISGSGDIEDPSSGIAPYKIYNIGNSTPVNLMDFLSTLENCLGKKAIMEMVEAQPGDVLDTWADCSDLERDYDYRPLTPLNQGIEQFVSWFKEYYRV